MASLDKVEAAMGKPVFERNGVKIYFKMVEPKTKRGKRRIEIGVRVPDQSWRNHHLLQYPFGMNVQYVNVTGPEGSD